MFRRLLMTSFTLILLASIAAATWAWQHYQSFQSTPLNLSDAEQTLDVSLGMPFAHIVREIKKRGLSDAHPLAWRVLAWEMEVSNGLHAGEYALTHGMTPRSLLARMAKGDVIQRSFTIVEGWNFVELRAALRKVDWLAQKTAEMSDVEIMLALDRAGVHPEGRFLPETYHFPKGRSDLDLLRRAMQAMDKTMAEAWQNRAPDLPINSAEEALILASIIEKETGVANERPRIAGVFARRLKIGMRLQTDPTVIYGIGSAYNGNITRKHLQEDTPYNTYTRFGLPPTPIALPGKDALISATQPADGKELYFVARGDGSHEFSANLAAHNAAVRKYQLKR